MSIQDVIPASFNYFMIVYRTGSFREAGRLIPMSTQGVTRAIQRLETSLGYQLFTLDGNRAIPTPFADCLMRHLERWHSDLGSLKKEMASIESHSVEIITLGMAFGTHAQLGLDFALRFEAMRPGCKVEYSETSDAFAESGLAAGSFDAIVSSAPYNDAFETVSLRSVPICALVPAEHPLSQRDMLCLHDLDGEAICSGDRSTKLACNVYGELENAGINPRTLVTTPDAFWAQMYAINGEGISVVDNLTAQLLADDPRVRVFELQGVLWEFGLSYLKSQRPSAAVLALADFLRKPRPTPAAQI